MESGSKPSADSQGPIEKPQKRGMRARPPSFNDMCATVMDDADDLMPPRVQRQGSAASSEGGEATTTTPRRHPFAESFSRALEAEWWTT